MGSLSLALAVTMLAAGAMPAARPIYLKTDEADGTLRLEVVGLASTSLEANYMLEVRSGGPAGTTRTVQKGSAQLHAGVLSKLNSVHLGGSARNGWSASLEVRLSSGETYREDLTSDSSGHRDRPDAAS